MATYIYEMEVRRRRVAVLHDAPRVIASSKSVSEYLDDLRALPTERLVVLLLDARNRVLGRADVAIGGTSQCAVEPSDVFRPVIVQGAVAFIVAHNHPSGECAPSDSDVAMTARLVSGAKLLGLRLLDHVIIGEPGRYFSFLDAGMLVGGAPCFWRGPVDAPVSARVGTT